MDIGQKLKEANPLIKIIAVEPAASPIISRGLAGATRYSNIDLDFLPTLLDLNSIDFVIQATEQQVTTMKAKLANEEGLFAGISSGANVFGSIKPGVALGINNQVLTISPGRGAAI